MRNNNTTCARYAVLAAAILLGQSVLVDSFEEINVYAVDPGDYTLQVGPADSSGETTLAFMVALTDTTDEEGLESAEEATSEAWEAYEEGTQEPVDLVDGDSATPSDTVVYRVDVASGAAVVDVPITLSGGLALLLEHGSDELPVVVSDSTGVALEATATETGDEHEDHDHDHEDHDDEDHDDEEHDSHDEEGEEDDDSPATSNQWANAIFASIVVSACSLVGVLVVASHKVSEKIDLSHACLVASGALLATALMHILPEALESLEIEYPDDLHANGMRAGLSLLAGMFFGLVVHTMLDAGHTHDHSHLGPNNGSGNGAGPAVTGVSGAVGGVEAPAHSTSRVAGDQTGDGHLRSAISSSAERSVFDLKGLQPVVWTVIAGDLVHNFADGVTIGAAFLGCSSAIGWTVTGAAVLHEIPHELADFMALINGGMSVLQAAVFNFLSALSAVLGVIIILSLRDSLSDGDVAMLLLFGGGSFIFIALSELTPGALAAAPASIHAGRDDLAGASGGMFSQFKKVVAFVFGALLVGIPLIWDQHCEADGHDH
ncbi:unnamed protein product [Sphacelaria rigidula]